jgi:hypothetical protein
MSPEINQLDSVFLPILKRAMTRLNAREVSLPALDQQKWLAESQIRFSARCRLLACNPMFDKRLSDQTKHSNTDARCFARNLLCQHEQAQGF